MEAQTEVIQAVLLELPSAGVMVELLGKQRLSQRHRAAAERRVQAPRAYVDYQLNSHSSLGVSQRKESAPPLVSVTSTGVVLITRGCR